MKSVSFSHFDRTGGIRYGISNTSHGSMRPDLLEAKRNTNKFISDASLPTSPLMRVKQIHSKRIIRVDSFPKDTIEEADGMLTDRKGIVLGVVTADCVPLLFYDPTCRLVGVVHAGWKGVSRGIISEIIRSMERQGASSEDVLVGIGPSIRSCCYSVTKTRVDVFRDVFDKSVWEKAIGRKADMWYLSLQQIITGELTRLGVLRKNIEDTEICTACSFGYYSFRKARDKANFGEFLTAISLV